MQTDSAPESPAQFEQLVRALAGPGCYPHRVDPIRIIETHASCVLLTGEFAYKIKKPVNLGFLDFSTLEQRRSSCEEELRLNRRTAPGIYLDVVPIVGTHANPRVGGPGPAIEYAVRMREFPQHQLLDRVARDGALTDALIDRLAGAIAAFHRKAERARPGGRFGSAAQIGRQAMQNFEQMQGVVADPGLRGALVQLREWTVCEHDRICGLLDARRDAGFVRECHGDLHLGNIALIEGVPTPFDAIEFSPEFRWIDVVSEVAFLTMDLHDHALPALAGRLLNAWLEAEGDYAGVALLAWYSVYRALVRAKVACIRISQPQVAASERARLLDDARRHVELALRFAAGRRPVLVLMHGLSGSGKTFVSQRLLEGLGAIRIRSDIERRRNAAMEPGTSPGSGVDARRYAPEARAAVYARLAALSRPLLAAGYPVIVDATFQQRSERERFRALARELRLPFAIASCHAASATLRSRIAERRSQATDASEADWAVAERQQESGDPLGDDERTDVIPIDTEAPQAAIAKALAEVSRRISAPQIPGYTPGQSGAK